MVHNVVKYLFALPHSLRQDRLARTRKPLTAVEFVHQIVSQGGDRDAALAVWETLRDSTYVSGFTPSPSDSLLSLFGIAEEELDEDMILAILKKLKVPTPSKEFVSAFGAIDTPLQLARFVALCRTGSSRVEHE